MATVKGKGGSPSHWYRPASQYDDATLAQKREYWRTKKREQRARQSERGRKAARASPKKHLHERSPAVTSPAACVPRTSSPQRSLPSHGAAAASAGGGGATAVTRKDKWLHTMKLSKVLPQLSSAALSRTGSSPSPAGRPPLSSSSVPPSGMNRMTNGSFAKATPQPRVSMQGAGVHTLRATHRQRSPHSATSPGLSLASPSDHDAGSPTPRRGGSSASVDSARARGGGAARLCPESEEERAARRREHWRIKKREQRAKQAARKATARARTDILELSSDRQTATVPPHSVRASLSGARTKNHRQQTGRAHLEGNQQTDEMRSERLHQHQLTPSVIPPDVSAGKKPEGTSPKLQSYVHLSAVIRGIARCKTPRQRCMEAQKNLSAQRTTRGKFLSLASSVHGSRSSLKINPDDTPEQIIAKRREHWRIKKREQRAKLSVETRARLKAKDSHMQRVRRYQKILEEMRRARVVGQPSGSPLTHASETIGGFIKEDGTVTTNIPQSSAAAARHQPHPQDRNIQAICAQGKVSFPSAGPFVHKPPRLLPARTPPQSTNAAVASSQLTLTHLHSPQAAAGASSQRGAGGCVMKMAVWSGVPTRSVPASDPKLTEEEKMAKKREYWRLKKREQRAARAARLKQSGLQTRVASALHRWKSPGPGPAVSASGVRRGVATQTLPNHCAGGAPLATAVKEEQESEPAADPHSFPEQTICPDVKPLLRPASPPQLPPAPPAPQPDPDPAQLSADSQATTLLAVASMKKLLEESLSTVTHCKHQLSDRSADQSEEDAKPCLTQLFFERDYLACDAAEPTRQLKGAQPDAAAVVSAASTDVHPPETAPPLCTSDEVALHPTCDHSSQTCSNFILKPCAVASQGPGSPLGAGPASPRPPPEHQRREQRRQAQENAQRAGSVPPQRSDCSVVGPRELSSLQKKREYWKLLKRQQRARLKARREGERSRQPSAQRLLLMSTGKEDSPAVKPALLPKPSVASLTAVTCISSVLVVSPTTCKADLEAPQVKGPLSGSGASRTPSGSAAATPPQHHHQLRPQASPLSAKWTLRGTEVDSVPSLPTLTPPDNPLSSINLHPIEPLAQTNSTLGPVPVPVPHRATPAAKLVPLSTMVPPKPIPGESEEEFLKRKREYWRVKKKEQRARKAFREKGMTSRRPSNTWRPILPSQETLTEQPCEWGLRAEAEPAEQEVEPDGSHSQDAEAAAFPYLDYTAPVEEESDLLFGDFKDPQCEEEPVSAAVWRNRYLMDYDPLNQLLVCMVCGELQYSHGLEGVRGHIDEAHPDTLSLEPTERQRILEAWDEQVSQRERFFTSQLRQHGSALAGADGS